MEKRIAMERWSRAILLVAAFAMMIVAAVVSPAGADEKGAGTGVSAWSEIAPSHPSYGLDSPQACDWDYKQHPWPSSSDDRVIYTGPAGPNNHYYEAWLSHELQTAVDKNDVCPNRIRTATDMTCYYKTTATGPRNYSSCGGWVYRRLAINIGGSDYDRVDDAEVYGYFSSNTGRPTHYSLWTNWYNECYLPMVEVDRIDFHGESWYLPDPANHYPIGCKVPYHIA